MQGFVMLNPQCGLVFGIRDPHKVSLSDEIDSKQLPCGYINGIIQK